MKPLVIVTTYNRKEETRQTLQALEATTDLDAVQLVIIDNGSTDSTPDLLLDLWSIKQMAHIHLLNDNLGCPRALNFAMELYRRPGQALVKLDNDVEILTRGWLPLIERFLKVAPVAMVGPWYDELTDERRLGEKVRAANFHYYKAFPLIGHMTWHAGWFLDQAGYFDVLAEDHLYGFEDLLMSHKAAVLGYEVAVLPTVKIHNLQRKNALDVSGPESRDEHVARLRPEYEQRVKMIQEGQYIFTDERGQPQR